MAISLGNVFSGATPRTGSGTQMPPVGSYVCDILAVKVEKNPWTADRNDLVLRLEIADGEYKGAFRKLFDDQKERFGSATYKGDFRIGIPTNSDEQWRKDVFERALGSIQASNDGYTINVNDVSDMKGKVVGITIREREYMREGEVRTTREVAFLETVSDVADGKVYKKHYEPRVLKNKPQTAESNKPTFVEVDEELLF